mmetsp:Transcript_18941/g.47226  ORF Transcript_18941/g.47226 Transcript_18941/m.47226 type:complete len:222 (-) Transcript_18941:1026-1691(-)
MLMVMDCGPDALPIANWTTRPRSPTHACRGSSLFCMLKILPQILLNTSGMPMGRTPPGSGLASATSRPSRKAAAAASGSLPVPMTLKSVTRAASAFGWLSRGRIYSIRHPKTSSDFLLGAEMVAVSTSSSSISTSRAHSLPWRRSSLGIGASPAGSSGWRSTSFANVSSVGGAMPSPSMADKAAAEEPSVASLMPRRVAISFSVVWSSAGERSAAAAAAVA